MTLCEATPYFHPADRPEAVTRWRIHCHDVNACVSCSKATEEDRAAGADYWCVVCGEPFNASEIRAVEPSTP